MFYEWKRVESQGPLCRNPSWRTIANMSSFSCPFVEEGYAWMNLSRMHASMEPIGYKKDPAEINGLFPVPFPMRDLDSRLPPHRSLQQSIR